MRASIAIDFLLLAAVWGSSFLFARLAVVEFGALPTAFGRCAIGAAVLLPLVFARGLGTSLRSHWRRPAAVGLLNSGLPFALYAFAVQHITTGLSAILNATVPLFGALVAWLWLGDRPQAARLFGLVIGFAGVALLAGDKDSFAVGSSVLLAAAAVAACLVACLCYAIAASATRLHLAGLPPLVTATGSQIGASLALALPALWLAPARMPSAEAWLAIGALGALCTGLAYVLYFRIIERVGPARALTVPFLIPVFAVFYGAVFLDEPVTGWMLACGAVVVLGTALSTGLLGLRSRPAAAGADAGTLPRR
jgi:drug/metabolite transporter (DMT)-like permease